MDGAIDLTGDSGDEKMRGPEEAAGGGGEGGAPGGAESNAPPPAPLPPALAPAFARPPGFAPARAVRAQWNSLGLVHASDAFSFL